MSKKLFPLLTIAALFLGGCVAINPSELDENWGASVAHNTNLQIVNPEGSPVDSDPGAVSDGMTTEAQMEVLRKVQAKPRAKADLSSVMDRVQ
jgi:hypothetical protein